MTQDPKSGYGQGSRRGSTQYVNEQEEGLSQGREWLGSHCKVRGVRNGKDIPWQPVDRTP